jgi:hypothetical protein
LRALDPAVQTILGMPQRPNNAPCDAFLLTFGQRSHNDSNGRVEPVEPAGKGFWGWKATSIGHRTHALVQLCKEEHQLFCIPRVERLMPRISRSTNPCRTFHASSMRIRRFVLLPLRNLDEACHAIQ